MFYISAASGITHQPTFKNRGFSGLIEPISPSSELLSPVFKNYIDAGLLRRMSKILRMSVTCAKDCLEQASIEQPDSIVVGTGFGCLQDTEKFLNNMLTIEGLLPPTAFIQSTHNTIAGQISLSIGNHGYNMTHTQNTLSFEHALLDAMLLLGEDDNHVLVGAADEYIEILDEVSTKLNLMTMADLTSGASFFLLSNEKPESALAQIVDVQTVGFVQDVPAAIDLFLKNNDLDPEKIDYVLFADYGYEPVIYSYFNQIVDKNRFINYSLLSGLYPTNSAFALHYALDKMQENNEIQNVLICNNLNKINLGLTLIQSVEA